MEAAFVIQQVRANATRLKELGVASLELFGSTARGEHRDDSDLDFLVDFDGPATFDRFMDLKFLLEDLFGRRVDLVTRAALREEIRDTVSRDLLRVA